MQLGQFADALANYQRADKIPPDDYHIKIGLASAARSAGSYGYAVVALKQATGLDGENPLAWALLGETLLDIYQAGGDSDAELLAEAIAAWRRSLDIDAGQLDVRQYLATYAPADEGDPPAE